MFWTLVCLFREILESLFSPWDWTPQGSIITSITKQDYCAFTSKSKG